MEHVEIPKCSVLGVKCSPGLGDGLPGPLATGFRFAPPFSCAPGETDGDGGVVGESIRSCICCSPILLGARLGSGGGGGGGPGPVGGRGGAGGGGLPTNYGAPGR